MAKRKTKRKTKSTRSTTRRTTKKKTTARRKTTRRKTTKKSSANRPRTKSQIFGEIAEQTELTRSDVAAVFDAMEELIRKDLGRRGPGQFTVPGLMKVVKQHKPRRPARRGINPFTGEETTFKAKPAHNVVKVRPLKALKEMV